MGHHVEYLIDLPPASARKWLSQFSVSWFVPELAGELPNCEFEWGGLWFHVDLGSTACQVRVPQIKYSGLIGEHPPTIQQVVRLEEWISQALRGVRAVRLDELLRVEWESQSDQKWHQWPDPVKAIQDWLLSTSQDARYYRLF